MLFTATQQWLDSFCIWVFEDYWYSNVYSKDNIEFLISEVRRVISLGQCGPLHTPIQSNHPSALAAGVVHTTHYSLTPLWLYKQAHLIFVVLSSFFFFFLSPWFTNMPPRSTDWSTAAVLSALPFRPGAWKVWGCLCKHSLYDRERGRGGGAWGWVASDTTSKTTHQTNTLKALSTLTLRHWMCVIRAFIDISAILELTFEVRV